MVYTQKNVQCAIGNRIFKIKVIVLLTETNGVGYV
jgi:hypothetical protein